MIIPSTRAVRVRAKGNRLFSVDECEHLGLERSTTCYALQWNYTLKFRAIVSVQVALVPTNCFLYSSWLYTGRGEREL